MKTTGIIRRIDELGRVVIPKELRRTMRIREGEEMEVYTTDDGGLLLKKYSALKDIETFSKEYLESVNKIINLSCAVTDRDAVIASCGKLKNLYQSKISFKMDKILENRNVEVLNNESVIKICDENEASYSSMVILPLVYNGDVMGSMVFLKETGELSMEEINVAKIGVLFLEKQL